MENEINQANYFELSNRKKYLSASVFKDFKKCEKEALAKLNGEIVEEKTEALLFGGYVDAYFSDELEEFIKNNPQMFNSKNGELKSSFKHIDNVIKAIEDDDMLMKYLNGRKQVVVTGIIAGVPFKGKIDVLHEDKLIVDQKIIRDLEPIWIEKNGKNIKTDFIDAYEYCVQGAIYQILEAQEYERKYHKPREKPLPFVLAITTKEENPDKALIEIDQEYLDAALEEVKKLAPRYWDIMQGKIQPQGCGKCSVCRKTKKVSGVQSYKKLFHNDTEDIEY